MALAVFFLEHLEPRDGVAGEVLQVGLRLLHALLDLLHRLVGLEAVVGGDALDADLGEADDVVVGHLAAQLLEERLQAVADFREHALPGLRFLDAPVDALLDENALERIPVPLLFEFAELDLELALEERLRGIDAGLEDVADAEELRLVVAGLRIADDDARGGVELHLAAREDVELLDDFFRLRALREMDEDLDLVGGVVVDVLDLDLALGVGGEDRLDERLGGDAEGQLGDREEIFGAHLDLRADLHLAAALAVVVFRKIGGAARGEIGKDAERFSLQMIDRRAAEVVEIVRENFRREADRDALGAFEQNDGKLGRQRDRLLVAAVVAELPRGGLRVEEHVLRECGETRLDVTRRGGIVAGETLP